MAELWEILDQNGNATGRLHERGKPMRNGEYLIWECTGGNAVAGDDKSIKYANVFVIIV